MSNKCDFCSNITHERQYITENSDAIVLYPLNPAVFGHLMIVTKRHVSLFTELTNDELISIKDLVSTFFNIFQDRGKGDGFNILNNNCSAADQHIPHFHLHLFIRKEGGVSPFDVLSKKTTTERISEEEWHGRLQQIRSWFN